MIQFDNKKPTLKDFGLSEEAVKQNNYAKEHRRSIINYNDELEVKGNKYGWATFGVIAVISLFAAAASTTATIVLLIVAAVAGIGVNSYIKGQKKNVPIFSPDIDKKYQQYLAALKRYEENQQKKDIKVPTKPKTITTTPKVSTKQTKKDDELSSRRKPTTEKLEIGMIVNHPTLGNGKIIKLDENQHEAYIYFEDSLSYKFILYNLIKLEIVERPKVVAPVVEKPKAKVEKPKTTVEKSKPIEKPVEKITKVYSQSGISLTESQELLFNEMYQKSLKYCVELQISEWRSLVGVGVIQQEHLRYWLHKSKGLVYVKFGDTSEDILLDVSNKQRILAAIKRVNEEFESNISAHILQSYAKKQESEQAPVVPEDKEDDSDIFGVDELSDDLVKDLETTPEKTIDYDETIFEIKDTSLIHFIGKDKQSSYEIPDGVTYICDNAFANNSIVYDIAIPSSVERIGNNVFDNCKKLRELHLPATIKEIGDNTFVGCDNLETIYCYSKAVKKILGKVPKNIDVVCLEI